MRKRGADLKPGDTIEVWWQPKRDTITALQPYTGALSYLFPEGAQLASFALNKSGMTIDNGELYAVVTPGA
jgi:hypothetical protein